MGDQCVWQDPISGLEQQGARHETFELREARLDDVAVLVEHRRRMFEDMRAARAWDCSDAQLDAMSQAYVDYLRGRLADGSLRAWVIEAQGTLVCSCVLAVLPWPPLPGDLSERMGHLYSTFTVPQWRRRGLAGRVVQAAIEFCCAQGIRRIGLSATDASRSLYESLGFRSAGKEMRLLLPS